MTDLISQFLAVLTIIAQLGLVFGLIVCLSSKKQFSRQLLSWLRNAAPLLALKVAMTATLGSLYYSEIAGYLPCTLCWYQRIAMYPLIVTLLLAVTSSERAHINSSLVLALCGLATSLYHNYLYFVASPLGSCSASGQGPSCLVRYITEFNYVTIPLMALTAFAAIIALLLVARRQPADKSV